MKKRFFAIAMIMLITLTLFVPISASAESEPDYYLYNSEVLPEIPQAQMQYYSNVLIYLSTYNNKTYVFYTNARIYVFSNNNKLRLENPSVRYELVDGVWTNEVITSGSTASETSNYRLIWSNNTIMDNYNTTTVFESSPPVFQYGGSPDMDTPEIEYTLSSGSYTLNNTLTLPDYEIIEDFASPFLVSTLDDQFNVVDVYNGNRIKIAAPSVSYNLDGTMTTVYNAPPLANAGWQNVGYKQIILTEDETVTEEFYNWFIANTTESPVTYPPYEFSNDGITYDGNTFASYENDDTKRIEIDDHYCVMFKNDTSSTIFVFTATEPLRLGTSTIKTKSGERLEYWSIKNGVITYSGDKLDFAIPHTWIAGNHSILNWDNDLPYQEFTTGMTVFRVAPQDSPTLVEIVKQIPMSGVMKEMIVILPCLIALLTGYLALRKALTLFRTLLLQA